MQYGIYEIPPFSVEHIQNSNYYRYRLITSPRCFVKAVAQQVEAIQATVLALQCCKINNNNANSKIFFLNVKIKKIIKVYIVGRQKIGDSLLCSLWDIFCTRRFEIEANNLFDALFETRWNRFYVRMLQCSIMFDCLSVRCPNVRLCSIDKMFGWVRLSSINEGSIDYAEVIRPFNN